MLRERVEWKRSGNRKVGVLRERVEIEEIWQYGGRGVKGEGGLEEVWQ